MKPRTDQRRTRLPLSYYSQVPQFFVGQKGTRRQLLKDGEMLATHVRVSTGRTRSDGMSSRITKLVHQRLPTDARIGPWAGRESGVVECGCGHKLEWANRDQVGQLQWHMFACSLPEETSVHLSYGVGGYRQCGET